MKRREQSRGEADGSGEGREWEGEEEEDDDKREGNQTLQGISRLIRGKLPGADRTQYSLVTAHVF